jgi:hypothetical protein
MFVAFSGFAIAVVGRGFRSNDLLWVHSPRAGTTRGEEGRDGRRNRDQAQGPSRVIEDNIAMQMMFTYHHRMCVTGTACSTTFETIVMSRRIRHDWHADCVT